MIRSALIVTMLSFQLPLNSTPYSIKNFGRLKDVDSGVESIIFLSEKNRLIASYRNGETIEWDYWQNRILRRIPGVASAVSEDRKVAVFLHPEAAVLRSLPDLSIIWRIPGSHFGSAAFSPDSQILVLDHFRRKDLWSLAARKKQWEFKFPNELPAYSAFDSSSRYYAISHYNKSVIALYDLTDIRKPKELGSLNNAIQNGNFGATRSAMVRFHPNANILAYSSYGDVHVTKAIDSVPPCILSGHTNFITLLHFSPDSQWLITSGGRWDPRVLVWDHRKCVLFRDFSLHKDAVAGISFLSNHEVISGDEDGKMYLWKIEQSNAVKELIGNHLSTRIIAVNEAERIVAAADYANAINLWSIPSDPRK